MKAAPSAPSRALMPDCLRLAALFGIVVVDVRFIAFLAHAGVDKPGGETAPNLVTVWLVNGFALFKTRGLFSFMFGAGLGFLTPPLSARVHRAPIWPPPRRNTAAGR